MTARAVLALAALLLFAAACGGDDDQGRVENPTSIEATIGPASTLPRGLTAVTPEHAATVDAASVQTTGVCVTLDLAAGDGISDKPEDVTDLTLNLEDVSDSIVWTSSEPATTVTGCYDPPQPLEPDIYAATVRYTDTTARTFIYNWQFEVTAPAP